MKDVNTGFADMLDLIKEIETIDNISFEEILKNAYNRLETQISIFQKIPAWKGYY